jgi:hypothetical protein
MSTTPDSIDPTSEQFKRVAEATTDPNIRGCGNTGEDARDSHVGMAVLRRRS